MSCLLPWTAYMFGNVPPKNGLLGDTSGNWIIQSKTAKLIGSCYGEHPFLCSQLRIENNTKWLSLAGKSLLFYFVCLFMLLLVWRRRIKKSTILNV